MSTRGPKGILNLGRRDRIGNIRLQGELESYRVELERFVERTADEGDPPAWADEATDLVDSARDALGRGDVEEGWFYLHAARRIELDGLTDREERRLRARLVLADADEHLEPHDQTMVRELLAGPGGRVREDVSIPAIREASRIVDGHHQNRHLKRRYVQEQFQALAAAGVLATLGFVLLGVFAEAVPTDVVPAPFADGAGTVAGFVPYVLLAGTVGSALFGLISSLQSSTDLPPLPQTISSGWMVVARAVTGAMSAFVLFLFLRSGLLNLGLPESPVFLLLVAVAAGYSERLAPATIENVLEKLEDESPSAESTGTKPPEGEPTGERTAETARPERDS